MIIMQFVDERRERGICVHNACIFRAVMIVPAKASCWPERLG